MAEQKSTFDVKSKKNKEIRYDRFNDRKKRGEKGTKMLRRNYLLSHL